MSLKVAIIDRRASAVCVRIYTYYTIPTARYTFFSFKLFFASLLTKIYDSPRVICRKSASLSRAYIYLRKQPLCVFMPMRSFIRPKKLIEKLIALALLAPSPSLFFFCFTVVLHFNAYSVYNPRVRALQCVPYICIMYICAHTAPRLGANKRVRRI